MLGNLLAPEHLFIVLAVILLMFGGKKIPELASGLGKGVREFKNGIAGAGEPTPQASPQVTASTTSPEPIVRTTTETVTVSAPPPEPKRLLS